jgi:hypothetical protein
MVPDARSEWLGANPGQIIATGSKVGTAGSGTNGRQNIGCTNVNQRVHIAEWCGWQQVELMRPITYDTRLAASFT